ncbi:Rossmann-fold NAD(P)-binding domain-containing protein [Rufibacter tibetensis]|uniref:Prolyl-tRNA synthetase n=1 Tax=Rufibacter tibetensis TaxID=512763 RepID=A0A0P0C799_9BACT|nr:hypothetical protein [Rufibacter tibetensis]ALI99251.1 hypothetical protein DC20_10025 [Rufibacter tibetensis]
MKYTTKKLLILPLLGFLAAGCSTSSNLQTSETDDVYFSSTDKVTYVEPPLEEQEIGDAEFSGTDDASRDITDRVSDPESYARNRRNSSTPYQYSYYDAPFGNPFYAYASPFYSPGRYYSRAIMMDPWMDPWYDPFYGPGMASMAMYDPFWPRPGMSIGIGLGFGRYYNPWGYGNGFGYGYNPYRFGGGGYGGGYYDNIYGGRVIANNVAYGRRNDRSSNTGRNPNISRDGRGSIAAPGSNRSSNATALEPGYRTRSSRSATAQPNGDGTIQPRRRQVGTPSGNQEIGAPAQERRMRTGSIESSQPVRRQRSEYTPAPSRTSESRSRSYEPSPSYEPTRSSSSSSGSSGGGSSSGGGRRGRN